MKSIGWEVERLGSNYFFVKKFPLIGSIAKIQRPNYPVTGKHINTLRKRYRTKIFYAEPRVGQDENFLNLGFKSCGQPFLPSKTIQIDLSKTEDKLLSGMHHKTRYNIKIAQKKGINVLESEDVETYADFWQAQARKRKSFMPERKFITSIYSTFGSDAKILTVSHQGELVSGILLLNTSDTSYYMYAASNHLGRRLHAPTLLVWEAIKLGKKMGLETLDFEGVYDERFPLPNWRGFSKFKSSFGGRVVEYPAPSKKFALW